MPPVVVPPVVPIAAVSGVAVGEGEASDVGELVGVGDVCFVGDADGLTCGVAVNLALAARIIVSTSIGLVRGGRH